MARRAILTDNERNVLKAEEDSDRYYKVVSRVRRKINKEFPQDVEIIKQSHSKLHQELLNVIDNDSDRLRSELEKKKEDIESKFPDKVTTKLTRFNNLRFGLWVIVNAGADHMELIDTVDEVGKHLHALGYNVRAVYDGRYEPDIGESHYEGHLYALPAEIGTPEYPVGEMPIKKDNFRKFEWKAVKNTASETTKD